MTVKWGILGAAGIARKQFLPAVAQSPSAKAVAIASRSVDKAQALADQFGVPQVYGDYAQLLADDSIDAIYIPLPNAQHVDWTIKALEAGKNVLCEKPIAMTADEIARIQAAEQATGRKAVEGFMVAHHPQWQQVRDWIAEGAIGKIQRIEGVFTYFLNDDANIRNRADGGALRDIGVYPVFATRMVSGQEPRRVLGRMTFDDTAEADIHTAGWMEFDGFDAAFMVSSRMDRTEGVTVFGTHGRIEVPKAFNPADAGAQTIHLFKGNQLDQSVQYDDVFQFALQVEHVSAAFKAGTPHLVTLENSTANQRVLDGIITSHQTGAWVSLD